MSLVAEYDSGSEPEIKGKIEEKQEKNGHKDNHEDFNVEKEKEELSPSKKVQLPPASSVINKTTTESTVFSTKYDKQADTQTKALEQHVKMVNNSKSLNGKVNGKRVCWMYRRGRCRLGKKCKMYHDSELQIAEVKRKNDGEQKNLESTPAPTKNVESSPIATIRHKREFDGVTNNDDECDTAAKKIKKKHFGLSDDLVPSAKVLRHLEKVSGDANNDLSNL